jgi:hypothetical protein
MGEEAGVLGGCVLEERKMDFKEDADIQVIRGNSVASIELLDSMRV